jgi:hypothetical protein
MHAARGPGHFPCQIRHCCIQRDVGAEPARQRQLVLGDVDGHHVQAHRLGVLHGDVAESTDAADGQPLARPGVGFFDSLVGCYAGAKNRRRAHEVQSGRQLHGIVRVRKHVLCITSIDAIACVVLALAQSLPSSAAVFARAARIMQPCNANGIALPQLRDALAQRCHVANDFVTRNEWQLRLHRPVPVDRMNIRVAHAAGGDLDQHLAWPRRGYCDIAQNERSAERSCYRSSHRLAHDNS